MPQTFETAVKEVIELPTDSDFYNNSTSVIHTLGYPLDINAKCGKVIQQGAKTLSAEDITR